LSGEPGDVWLDQLRADGVQALAQVLSHYRERLVKMIDFRLDTRLMGRLDVDDVLQEVYLMSARRLDDFLANPAVPTFVWMRTMAQQVLADVHRRHLGAQKRDARRDVPLHRRQGDGATSGSIAARLADSLTSPSKAAARADMRQHLYSAFEQMDPIDREVLALRHFEDLTNGEVAAVLGLKQAAASNRYVRALKRLREIMTAAGAGADDAT
jgi:RNA polymerase sigma-70 factor, ECF subfamily